MVAAHPDYDVVIPCYNRAHVLGEAVVSVLSQTIKARSIVIADDGSQDESRALIEKLTRQYECITAVFQPQNRGASAARNAGAAQCNAPWIAFLDSDDVWTPDAAETLLSRASTARVIVGNFSRIDGKSPPQPEESLWQGEDIAQTLRTRNVVGPSWTMMSRQSYDMCGGFDPNYKTCNDWDLYARVQRQGCSFVHIPKLVAYYRTVGKRLTDGDAQRDHDARRVMAGYAGLQLG